MYRYLLGFVVALTVWCSPNINAQSLWLEQEGGLSNDEALDISNNGSSEVHIVGYVGSGASIGPVTSPGYGISDIFVSERTSNGSYSWVQFFGGSGPDRALAVCSDAFGNVYVTGFFTGTALFGSVMLTSLAGSQDIFICKLNSSGVVQWAVRAGGDEDDIGYGLDVDNTGNVYVVGQFSGTGTFGSFPVTSANYPDNSGPSQDIFVCKLNSNGGFVWVKTGEASDDDRALDISVTTDNKLYVCGYFTNDLQMDQLYTNSVDNIGFVLQLDALGNELNMTYYTSVFLKLEDIESAADGSYFLAGSYQGQMIAPASFNALYTSLYANSIFILRAQPDGTILWFEDISSENDLTCKAMDLDADGYAYINAVFSCDLTELNLEYGGSLLYSAGYDDVLVAKYSPTGNREWVAQYGGPGEAQSQGIAVLAPDFPVITGGFSGRFCVPDAPGTWSLGVTDTGSNQFVDNFSLFACDGWQGDYRMVNSSGNRDIFITCPFSINAPLYNFQDQVPNGSCNQEIPLICFEQCLDTIYMCVPSGAGIPTLTLEYYTEELDLYGPLYDFDFSSNVTSYYLDNEGFWNVYISGTGWYVVTATRQDGCGEPLVDSIYVEIQFMPPAPFFESQMSTFQPGSIDEIFLDLCMEQDVVDAIISSSYSDAYWTFNGDTIYDNPIVIDTSGVYNFYAIFTEECSAHAFFDYEFHDEVPPEAQDAELILQVFGEEFIGDSIWICPNEEIIFSYDFNTLISSSITDDLNMYWLMDGQSLDSLSGQFSSNLSNLTEGWHTLEVWVNYENNGCDYISIQRDFYVVEYESVSPWIIEPADFFICPGEVVEVDWSYGPEGVEVTYISNAIVVDDNTISISEPDVIGLHVAITTEDGCSFQSSAAIVVEYFPIPVATSDPENAVICPGDQVSLSVTPGASYMWIGPEGSVASTEQIYSPSVPGEYFCIMTNEDGCPLESNFIDVSEYSTPYLASSPWTYFCIQDTIFLDVITNEQSSISWLPPLSGSAMQQFIFDPGVYSVITSLCNITDTLSIEIGASPVDTTLTIQAPDYFCQGDTIMLIGLNNGNVYFWNGALQPSDTLLITEPGVYSAYIQDYNGCEAFSTVFEIEYYVPPMLSTSGYYACPDSTFLLQSPGDWQTVWLDENFNWLSDQSEYETTPVTDTLYYYTYLTHDECVTDTLAIPVMPYQMNTLEWTNVILCEDEMIQFDLQFLPNTQVVWDFGVDEVYGIDEPSYVFSHPGVYPIDLQLINPFGCPQHLWDTLTILTKPMGSFVVDTDMFCSPESLVASNTSLLFDSTEWAFGSETWTDQDLNQPIVHLGCDPLIQDLRMIVTASTGCQDTVFHSITVWPQPIPQLAFDSPITCFPDLFVDVQDLTQCSDQSFWFVDGVLQQDGQSVELFDNEGDEFDVQLLAINSYGCSNTLDSHYVFTHPPALMFQLSTWAGCEDLAIQMETLNSEMDSVIWFIGNSWSDYGSQSDVVLTDPGLYDFGLIAANAEGCADTLYLSQAIEVFPTPEVDFTVTPDPGTMFDATFKFVEACNGPMFSYTWDMAGLATLYGDSVTYNFGEWLSFDVELTAVSPHGCVASAIQTVSVITQAFCFVPNTFTPDGDGVNDSFIPRFSVQDDITSYHFEIRDRWGLVVFETNAVDEAWQGQMRDGKHVVSNDAYLWSMEYTLRDKEDAIHSSGIVLLVR